MMKQKKGRYAVFYANSNAAQFMQLPQTISICYLQMHPQFYVEKYTIELLSKIKKTTTASMPLPAMLTRTHTEHLG